MFQLLASGLIMALNLVHNLGNAQVRLGSGALNLGPYLASHDQD
jgi:hypothetical protein